MQNESGQLRLGCAIMKVLQVVLITVIIAAIPICGCIDESGFDDKKKGESHYIDYNYNITVVSLIPTSVIIPVIINFSNDTVLDKEKFTSRDSYMNNTEYGPGFSLFPNGDLKYQISGRINMEKNDYYISSRYYLSLATNYYEELDRQYKHQGSEFRIYSNTTNDVTLSFTFTTKYYRDHEMQFSDLFVFNHELRLGWNIYYALEENSGD